MQPIHSDSPAPLKVRLCIGLLVHDRAIKSKHLHEFINWTKTEENVSVSNLIVMNDEAPYDLSNKKGSFKYYLRKSLPSFSHLILGYIEKFEALRLRSIPDYKDHLQALDIQRLFQKRISTCPSIDKKSLIYTFSDADVARISELKLDLLVSYGNGMFSEKIIESARLGMIVLEHNDGQHGYGQPPGFWEVYKRSEYTGFVIRHLTKTNPKGRVLVKGKFKTEYFYLINQAALYRRSRQYLQNLIRQIATVGFPPELENSIRKNHFKRHPLVHQNLLYWLTICARITIKILRKAGRIDYQWNVAFCNNDWRNAELSKAIRVINPTNHFLADPFVVSRNNTNYCFVEDYDYATGKAHISAYQLESHTATRLGIALKESFHLSFPYLFEYGEDLYMCPETSENCDIRIYKSIDFPLQWALEKVLMSNVSAADTMIFKWGKKWWMFTNMDSLQTCDHCNELHIYFSEDPISEKWEAHPKNPIMIDADGGRNGGILCEGDRIFRISQRQGFDMYGKGSAINEIITLTESEYQEKRLMNISSDSIKGAVGTHHFHSNGKTTVYDFLTVTKLSKNTR